MRNIEQVFLSMKDEIERLAKQEEKVILEEVKVLEDEAYESMKKEAKRDAELKLKQDEEEMSSQASTEISKSHIERTKKLIQKRDEYVKDIFDQAKKELENFVKSDAYLPFMIKKIEKIGHYFDNDSIIYIRSVDLNIKNELIKAIGHDIRIEVSGHIQIGGLIMENQSTQFVIDETLDLALNDQKEWFHKNSGLMIK